MFSTPFLFLILFILALPFLFLFGVFKVLQVGFENIGIAPEYVLLVLVLMIVGSFVNIPLGKRKIVEVRESRFFGLISRQRLMAYGLSLNVGGAVIPVGIALLLLPQVPLESTLIAVLVMTAVSFALSRFIPGRGIALPVFIPPLFALVLALILAPEQAPLVAFISGVLGTLIGADLLRLSQVISQGEGVMSIGGAGVFDGIFLVGIAAALLAGL